MCQIGCLRTFYFTDNIARSGKMAARKSTTSIVYHASGKLCGQMLVSERGEAVRSVYAGKTRNLCYKHHWNIWMSAPHICIYRQFGWSVMDLSEVLTSEMSNR